MEEQLIIMPNSVEELSSFIWVGKKVFNNVTNQYIQMEKRLIDMSEEEIHNCYEHCKKMLYNKNIQTPGRYLILKDITDQQNRCGVELFLRWLDKEGKMSRLALTASINSFLNSNKEAAKTKVLDDMFSNIPSEYGNLSATLLLDGCIDRLGVFNKKQITRAFILRQGIWLTPTEVKDFNHVDAKNRIELVKTTLQIKPHEKLFINDKGINLTQMRAMLNLRPNKKYIDLTTIQLETLRYRILFNLEETVKNHINSWNQRMEELELIAEYKNYRLVA
jgi:hypothetical protein